MARPICLRLFTHWARRAASRALCTAGSNRAIRTAMIAITTSSSISVKPRVTRRGARGGLMGDASPPCCTGRGGSRSLLRVLQRPLLPRAHVLEFVGLVLAGLGGVGRFLE